MVIRPTHSLFLSRLCGGEGAWYTLNDDGNFLSRLCGGEVANLSI